METRLQRCNSHPNNARLYNGIAGLKGEVPHNKEHHLELQEYFRRLCKNPEVEAYDDYKEDLGNIDLNGLEWVGAIKYWHYYYVLSNTGMQCEYKKGLFIEILMHSVFVVLLV